MDARSFGMYVKDAILKKAKEYDNNLLSATFKDIESTQRAAGVRDGLLGISSSMDNLLEEFYAKGGHSLPGQANSGVEPVNPVEDTPTIGE